MKQRTAADLPLLIIAAYYLFAFVLVSINGIDIFPPCLWDSLLGVECPGCGITRAVIKLSMLNFKDASNANPLVFAVIPLIIFQILRWGFYRFRQD
ncbi:MAG: DUF2752 domain-containing protein [Ignavibacteriaceae bacterium]|nr:DUF2752 domain-containing protein [Ignavibacteriaceae bacterium]